MSLYLPEGIGLYIGFEGLIEHYEDAPLALSGRHYRLTVFSEHELASGTFETAFYWAYTGRDLPAEEESRRAPSHLFSYGTRDYDVSVLQQIMREEPYLLYRIETAEGEEAGGLVTNQLYDKYFIGASCSYPDVLAPRRVFRAVEKALSRARSEMMPVAALMRQ